MQTKNTTPTAARDAGQSNERRYSLILTETQMHIVGGALMVRLVDAKHVLSHDPNRPTLKERVAALRELNEMLDSAPVI